MREAVSVNFRKIGTRILLFSILINVVLALIKGVTGYLGHSYALIADALESTSDVLASFLVVLGLQYFSKPPDKGHPYGHGRAEPLFTFIIVAFLCITAIVIIYQSIGNIMTPHQLPASYTVYILAGIIVIKEILYRWLNKISQLHHSSILRAEAQHHRSDAISSLGALAGIIIARILGPGYEAADDWAALLAACVILYNAYNIFRPAWGEIMDEQMHDGLVEKIKALAQEVAGVKDTEKCYVRKSGSSYLVDLHLEVDGQTTVSEGHKIAHEVEDRLKESGLGINYVSIHVEPFPEQNTSDGYVV